MLFNVIQQRQYWRSFVYQARHKRRVILSTSLQILTFTDAGEKNIKVIQK